MKNSYFILFVFYIVLTKFTAKAAPIFDFLDYWFSDYSEETSDEKPVVICKPPSCSIVINVYNNNSTQHPTQFHPSGAQYPVILHTVPYYQIQTSTVSSNLPNPKRDNLSTIVTTSKPISQTPSPITQQITTTKTSAPTTLSSQGNKDTTKIPTTTVASVTAKP